MGGGSANKNINNRNGFTKAAMLSIVLERLFYSLSERGEAKADWVSSLSEMLSLYTALLIKGDAFLYHTQFSYATLVKG